MGVYEAKVIWNRGDQPFLDKGYSRANYSYDGAQYGYREEGRALMFGVTWTPEL